MNLYVGNLPFKLTDEELQEVFEQFGEVSKASVVRDRETGRSRGFGFVEMPNAEQAKAAMSGVKDIDGRDVTVNEARPKENKPRREFGGRY